jgi:hypothetical protein
MAVLHSMKKTPAMKTVLHLTGAFVKRVAPMVTGHAECSIVFLSLLRSIIDVKDKIEMYCW